VGVPQCEGYCHPRTADGTKGFAFVEIGVRCGQPGLNLELLLLLDSQPPLLPLHRLAELPARFAIGSPDGCLKEFCTLADDNGVFEESIPLLPLLTVVIVLFELAGAAMPTARLPAFT
jgi:hypothetical protein